MNAQGTDLWVKSCIGLVAVTFVLSLPTWALGLILVLGLAVKTAVSYLREPEPPSEQSTSSTGSEPDAH